MASSTYQTYLMVKGDSSETYTKLVDIKDFPDLGGAPEMLDTTTLSDAMTTNIPGIQSVDALEFTANYTPTDFSTLKAMEGKTKSFAVWLGASGSGSTATPDGSMGKFTFDGQLSVYKNGGGVNEVQDMTITIAASSVIQFATGA